MDFQQAEKKFKQLKAQFEAGKLTEAEFKEQLEELMVQDEGGNWWMIGFETERWYQHDGTNWVQADPPDSYLQKTTFIPAWVTIFWIAQGWALGSAIGIAVNFIGKDLDSITRLTISGGIIGAIGGVATAIALRAENSLSNWKSTLWVILAWTVGCAISWAFNFTAVSWAIGGFVVATTLQIEKTLSSWRSTSWIILAWVISSAIAQVVSSAINQILNGDTGWIIGWAIGGAIGGAIAGIVTVYVIRKNQRSIRA